MATNTREEWMSIFKGPGIPCSPVHSLGELVNHPHTMASDMLLTYNNDAGRELNGVAAPLRINGERIPLRCKPPRLGQHSLEVLAAAGLRCEGVERAVEPGRSVRCSRRRTGGRCAVMSTTKAVLDVG